MQTLTHTLATFAHMHAATHNYAFLVKQSKAVYVVWMENITVEDIETQRDNINKVTVDDVVKLNEKIKLSTIYMLKGDNN